MKKITLMKLGMVFVISALVTACANQPMKAPCDRYASFCGTKTKINRW